jgi:methyl-accepting chemotaxis protein
MAKSNINRQRYFIERDLFFQTLTLLLTVLLGGFLLLLLSKTISSYVDSSLLFLMLFIGYFMLIIFFAWSLSRKFIGPFSRLKEIMKDIANGDLSLRLHVRDGDDIRIKSFVEDANRMIASLNNSLDRIKQPSQDIENRAEKLLYKIKSENTISAEEGLESLQNLVEDAKLIRQSIQHLKTRKSPAGSPTCP